MFDSKDITYAVMKGADIRELVYEDPALRPANDIDILVSPAQRETGAQALIDAGYELHGSPATVSHEATFSKLGHLASRKNADRSGPIDAEEATALS